MPKNTDPNNGYWLQAYVSLSTKSDLKKLLKKYGAKTHAHALEQAINHALHCEKNRLHTIGSK